MVGSAHEGGAALIAALVLAATVIATAEQPVSIAREGTAARSYQDRPVSATNGTTMLVAWRDDRGGQFVRFDASGQRLDAHSIPLPLLPSAAFWDGEQFIVMNSDAFARIDADGTPIDRTPQPLDPDITAFQLFGVVWAGDAAILVVGDFDKRELVAWTLGPNMVVTAKTRLGSYGVDNYVMPPVGMASNGSTAMVFFTEGLSDRVYGALFDRFGQLVHREVVSDWRYLSVDGGAVGTDGDRYIVVLRDSTSGYAGFTIDRNFRTRSFAAFTVAEFGDPRISPKVVFDGTAYTAHFAYIRDSRLRVSAVRLDRDGGVLSRADVPGVTYGFNVFPEPPLAEAIGTTAALLYWKQLVQGRGFITARIEAAGTAVEHSLSTGSFEQIAPIAASGATQSIVAWRENVAPGNAHAIYATRVDAQRKVLDPQSILLGGTTCTEVNLAAVSSGAEFLIAWHEANAVAASIVRADGTGKPVRVFARPLNATCTRSAMAVASSGSMYLVAWTELNDDERDVFAVRVAHDGTVLDEEPIALRIEGGPIIHVASDGRDFLVVSGSTAARVASDGAQLDGVGFKLKAPAEQAWWNGSSYVVPVRVNSGYRFRRIGSDGSAVGDSFSDVGIPHPWTGSRSAFGEGGIACDARDCSFAVNGIDDKPYLTRAAVLANREEMYVDPISGWTAGYSDDVQIAGAGDALFVVYSRRATEHGNATRVFLRPVLGLRKQAVRH